MATAWRDQNTSASAQGLSFEECLGRPVDVEHTSLARIENSNGC